MAADSTFTFTDSGGFEIFVHKWAPDADATPRAVVQIAHGAAEHALRYERFARFLNAAGYVVYANDHRGHWKTAGTLDKAGIAGEDGWNGMVNGYNLVLKKNRKVVQAWRMKDWPKGMYSTVTYSITRAGNKTKLSLNHQGVPPASHKGMTKGWNDHFFVHMKREMAQT